MARFVVIREEDAVDERLIEESAIPEESVLHRVLMSHPSLVPATDLGLGKVAAVGFEASLAAGSADLVLLDDAGRLCIVEVKKEGNPDTRRVVAQLLDYAAALWGLTLEQFERDVIRDQDGNPRDLRELVREELVSEVEDSEAALERLLEDLALTLRTGDFELVVAAPTIPEGVQRVMEYLNNQGQRLFGLEVSYFAAEGEVEAFVPRLVVRPSLGTTGTPPIPSSRYKTIDDLKADVPDERIRSWIDSVPKRLKQLFPDAYVRLDIPGTGNGFFGAEGQRWLEWWYSPRYLYASCDERFEGDEDLLRSRLSKPGEVRTDFKEFAGIRFHVHNDADMEVFEEVARRLYEQAST